MPYGSPNEMGHSPAEMSPYKMESAKQEKKNLMQDMPIDNRASSWMSKHSNSAMMMKGPMEMGHSPAEMGHSPAEMGHSPLEGHCMGSAAKMSHNSPAEFINPMIVNKAVKTAKKVGKAVKKVGKKIKEDLFEGGAERHRKKFFEPAKVFKKQ